MESATYMMEVMTIVCFVGGITLLTCECIAIWMEWE
jgi:hypothetical protein